MALLSWHLLSANQLAVLPSTKHHLELPNFQLRYLSAFLTMQQKAQEGKFVEALRHADHASRILREMAEGQGYPLASDQQALAGLRSRLAENLAKAGAEGEALVSLLPAQAKLRLDPQRVGEAGEWFRPRWNLWSRSRSRLP